MKNVKAILINSSKKEIKEIKFDGDYHSIYELIGEDVELINHHETLMNDCIFFEDTDECQSKHFVSIEGKVYRGNVLITGESRPSESGRIWNAKNVQVPLCLWENVIEFHDMEEVEFKV